MINFKFGFHINIPSYFIIVPGLVKTQFGDCIIYIYILQTVPEYNRSRLIDSVRYLTPDTVRYLTPDIALLPYAHKISCNRRT